METQEKINLITASLNSLLKEKNKRYGNAALEPLGIFSKLDGSQGIGVRLDDKLSRIKNSHTLRRNDVADIMGYLVLLCAANDWIDFSDLID